MPCILNIETATEVCSVTVTRGKEVLFQREETKGPSHAVLLGVFVDEAIKELRNQGIKPDAVAVSCGPGSYTGLRIGVSEAKGLCYGLEIPLIAVPTLKIMAYHVIKNNLADKSNLLCPMIDARRMEVYDTLYDHNLNEIRAASADIIDESSFSDYLSNGKVVFFGNGSDKCKEILGNPNAIFLEDIYPRSIDMVDLSEKLYDEKQFVDVAYFEPFYLKEFVATTPKNKVLPDNKK